MNQEEWEYQQFGPNPGRLYYEKLRGGEVKTWKRALTVKERAACQRFLKGIQQIEVKNEMAEQVKRNEVVLAGTIMRIWNGDNGVFLLLDCNGDKKWIPCRSSHESVAEILKDAQEGDYIQVKGRIRKGSRKTDSGEWQDTFDVRIEQTRLTKVATRSGAAKPKRDEITDDDIPF